MPYRNQHTPLKNGLTTGTCASAVAKASAYMLIHQCIVPHVSVKLPDEKDVILELKDCSFSEYSAHCSTVKDAGDDPDITHGATISAKATFSDHHHICLKGGTGIGKVTKQGLAVEVGKPAINPVPYKMIIQAVQEVVPKDTGMEIELSIPNGEKLAQKTFNPQLGIVGGLSILGTTGIVKPMSEEALKDSLIVKLNQLAKTGKQEAIFTPGNYSTSFSKHNLEIDEDDIVLTSNYIGYMLEQAVNRNFKKVLLIGHLGKLVKLAGGIFQTHSRIADGRNEILASHYFLFHKDTVGFEKIMKANTTEETVGFIKDKSFWNYLAIQMKSRSERYVHQELKVEVVLLSQKAGLLATTPEALTWIKNSKHD